MLTLRRSTPLFAVAALSSIALTGEPRLLAGQAATPAALSSNFVTNGTFATGTTSGWSLFALPAGAMESRVRNGVFEWNRTGDSSSQASISQNTGKPDSATPVEAAFDIGNSANIRQRISVLVFDADFSDLSLCTFWLEPGAPMRTYRMRTHPTKPWANASIAFYAGTAASAAANGGFLRLDNVSLATNASGSDTRTDCVDPTTPPPPGGAESASLILNGNFNLGLSFWQTYGTMTSAVAGGVFFFIRNPGLPAGVIFQTTNAPAAANEFLTARLDLGNSSPVRKRVSVVVHARDFSDLAACTFWLQPGQPRSPYVMRMRATRPWGSSSLTGATLSVYGGTVGAEVWMELDNVSLTRSPGTAIQGTECIEPIETLAASSTASTRPTTGSPSMAAGASPMPRAVVRRTIDRNDWPRALAEGASWLADASAPIEVQVSRDGSHWVTVARVPPGDDQTEVVVDLAVAEGEPVLVRVIYVPASASAGWRIIRLRNAPPPAARPHGPGRPPAPTESRSRAAVPPRAGAGRNSPTGAA
jgi:hypothetical protein